MAGAGSANVLVGPGSANVLVGMSMRCQRVVIHGFAVGLSMRRADGDVGAPRGGAGSANVLVGMRMRCPRGVIPGFAVGLSLRRSDGDIGAPRYNPSWARTLKAFGRLPRRATLEYGRTKSHAQSITLTRSHAHYPR